MIELLREIVSQPGLSSYEEGVRNFIIEKIQKTSSPKIYPSGNLTVTKGKEKPKILFSAHMDEIGMVVGFIEENGFLRIRKVGLLDDKLLIGRIVQILTSKGKVDGVIGIRPPHLYSSFNEFEQKRDVPLWDEVFIDVGTNSKKETEELGIKVMDPILFKKEFVILNNKRCAARSLDDRFGCALLIKALEEVAEEELNCEVTFAWTVQEEVGAIGGKALAHDVDCDVMFAVDSYACADVPGIPFHYGPAYLGQGPVLRLMDHYSISTPSLARWVVNLAQEAKIPLQVGPTGGYTDGQHFLAKGVPMLMLALPMRYMHSPAETIDLDDLENLLRLILLIIRSNKNELNKIILNV